MDNEEKKPVALEEEDLEHIIIKIPIATNKLTIESEFIDENGETRTAEMKLNLRQIHACREDFLDNVEDGDYYDVRYVITEEGKRWLEQFKNDDE